MQEPTQPLDPSDVDPVTAATIGLSQRLAMAVVASTRWAGEWQSVEAAIAVPLTYVAVELTAALARGAPANALVLRELRKAVHAQGLDLCKSVEELTLDVGLCAIADRAVLVAQITREPSTQLEEVTRG